MSVQSQTPYNSYTANGATTVFPYGFLLLQTSDLVVTVDGVVKALTTDYTVSGIGTPSGGNVTFLSAPSNGAKVLLKRLLTIQRLTDYQNNGDLLAVTLNQDLDRVWLALQQLQQNDIRALKLPFDTATDQVLTQDASGRALKGIRFDASGNMALSTYDPDAAQTAGAAAAGSATAAAGSATAAAGSATAAAGSATSVGFTASSVTTFTNKTMTAAGGNSVEATSGPGASAFSLRNKIINGGMQIVQRGPVALSATANTTYCADRITVKADGGTGLAGNGANMTTGGNTASGYAAGALSANWTAATMKVQTRLEDVNCIHLNSKQITISGKLYHTIGSARTCQVVVQKANSANNFGAVTTLGTSATFSALDSAYTSFSYTLTLGGSDATNGLLISVEDTAASTVTGKTFAVGDLQLEQGSVATPFEVRPIGVELALCQRYFETSYDNGSAPGTSTTNGAFNLISPGNVNRCWNTIYYKVSKRVAPTVTFYSTTGASGFVRDVTTSTDASCTASASGASNFVAQVSPTITAVTDTILGHFTSSAEL